jgi:hypothetical protein
MPATKTKTPRAFVHSTAITRKFLRSIEPVDLSDLFELVDRLDPSTADAHFEALVDIQLAAQVNDRRLTRDEYRSGRDAITNALPENLRTLHVRVSDYENDEGAARTDVAFRLGVKIGKALAGGVR